MALRNLVYLVGAFLGLLTLNFVLPYASLDTPVPEPELAEAEMPEVRQIPSIAEEPTKDQATAAMTAPDPATPSNSQLGATPQNEKPQIQETNLGGPLPSVEGPATVAAARNALRAQEFGAAAAILSSPELARDAEALNLLATLFRNGTGVIQSDFRAFELTRQAAELGNLDAQVSLGRLYYSGRGVEADQAQAQAWMARAAEAGHVGATEALVLMMAQMAVPEQESETPAAPAQIAASDIASRQGKSPLHEAAERGQARLIAQIVDDEKSADIRDPKGRTPLMLAAAEGHQDAILALIEHGARSDATDSEGRSPLMHAAIHGADQVVGLLLDHALNLRDKDGNTAFDLAILNGECAAAASIRAAGANDADDEVSDTVLAGIVSECDGSQIAALAGTGIAVDFTDRHGRDAIWYAAKAGNTEAVGWLLDRGADPVSADAGGVSALLVAINGAHEDAALELIMAGANLESQTSSGNTPIMIAATRGLGQVVETLLSKGVDVDHRNNDGYSALMLASKFGRIDIGRMLVGAGADTGLRNVKRERATDIALAAGYAELAALVK